MGVTGDDNAGAARDAMGRPTKLTPDRQARIVELIKAGNYIEVACAAAGITDASYYKWMSVGRAIISEHGNDETEWPNTLTEYEVACAGFFEACKIATAEAEAYAVTAVRTAMPKNWAAAMTYLERRFPGRWKRRDAITVDNPFDIQGAQGQGLDEAAMLQDPEAVHHLHRALELAARGQLPPGEPEVVDAQIVED